MFAVKGWNVDASSLKPQTEVFKSNATNENGDGKKKRKRDGEHQESKKKKLKKEKKRQKLAEENANYAPMGESKWQPRDAVSDEKDEQTEGGAPVEKEVKEAATTEDKPEKKNKRRKKKDKQQDGEGKENATDAPQPSAKQDAPPPVPPMPAGAKLTPMQAAMRQKLVSARFRHLNQTLYTEDSTKALDLFTTNPEMFEDYHSGFRQQVAVWPENPVDNFIATIRSRGSVRLQSQKKAFKGKGHKPDTSASEDRSLALPRTQGTCTIADLGCGDARLASTLKSSNDLQTLQCKVLSYDLHSPSPLVTKADISALPTASNSINVAIFCLALMGSNWISFIEEAYRILHWKGELWIAEIKSRFGRVSNSKTRKPVEHSVGGKRRQAAIKKAQDAKSAEQEVVDEQRALAVEVDGVEEGKNNQETDVSAFVEVLKRRGFLLKNGESSIDLSNKMFVKMEFVKAATPTKGKNKPDESENAGKQQQGERFKKSKVKFLEENDDDVPTDDEAKTLKPCLYKIR